MLGNAENFPDIVVVENADPADADAFRPRGEPEVLHGTDRGIDIHARIVRSAQHHGAATAGDVRRAGQPRAGLNRVSGWMTVRRMADRFPGSFRFVKRLFNKFNDLHGYPTHPYGVEAA